MVYGLKTYGSTEILLELAGKKPLFTCVIATTATSRIPNLSGAGAGPELMEYTPAGDSELIVRGELLCCDIPPQTVSGGDSAPTPAMITKAVLELTDVPYLIADAGSKIKPDIPYFNISERAGGNIMEGNGVKDPKKIFENGKLFSKEISKTSDYLVVGESIPGGTTTALGVLTGLGYDASFKVSGSSPENPHDLKKEVVLDGIKNGKIAIGESDPFDVVKAVGDPMIPAVAGIVLASEKPVILAGGTQMTAVLALIKAIQKDFDFSKIAIATTSFVADDESADLLNIVSQIDDNVAVHVVYPEFEKSSNEGLKNYTKGFVKEGVGAGGAILMGLLLGHSMDEIRLKIEDVLK